MASQKGKGVVSNTNHNLHTTNLDLNYDSPNLIPRPSKLQKTQIPNLTISLPSPLTQATYGGDPDTSHSNHDTEFHQSAQYHQGQQSEENLQDNNAQEEESSEPFFYYQDVHVQDSLNQCKNSIIGKILSEKPISNQVLHNSLSGIWCNPLGFKISEIEGRLLQFKMDRDEDVQRILKGSPWVIRNCWLILHGWHRNLDISRLDFNSVPLWIQFWGLPLHCKSITMGKELGSQIGTVLDVGLYEFPENVKIIKVKILFNVINPIRAGMYIGNNDDGVNWVDFRFENLPMFCFGCGLIGHNQESCKLTPIPIEGGINPRGAWLRTRSYGRRIYEKQEKTFRSNPMKSLSGGPFSPIPKGLVQQMAAMQIRKQETQATGQASAKTSPQHTTSKVYNPPQKSNQVSAHNIIDTQATRNHISIIHSEEHKFMKRKVSSSGEPQLHIDGSTFQDQHMAGLEDKASHLQ